MSNPPSLTEFAVLGVLAEESQHGFAIARELSAEGEIGRVFTVRRSLVYRALDRMVESGLTEPVSLEPGEGGPTRRVHRITARGAELLEGWLFEPVDHIRELRIEFMVKLTLLKRRGDSAAGLIENQLHTLEPAFAAFERVGEDHVSLWRKHTAAAAAAFLNELRRRTEGDG